MDRCPLIADVERLKSLIDLARSQSNRREISSYFFENKFRSRRQNNIKFRIPLPFFCVYKILNQLKKIIAV